MHAVRYHDLTFHHDMLSVQRDDGTPFRLTRKERALLLRLVRQPQKLVTRTQLLEALGDENGVMDDRNVDYLVNRLRKRLGDDARNPRFIATQYGEGYVWLPTPEITDPVSAFLLIGPIYGLAGKSRSFIPVLERLTDHIESSLGGEHKVRCLPEWRSGTDAKDDVSYALETSILEEDGEIHLALVLKEGKSGVSIAPFRIILSDMHASEELKTFAATLSQTIWHHAALPNNDPPMPTDRPLHLRLHDAAMMLTADNASWQENARRLDQAHAANPDDPIISVLLALNRYAQLIQAPVTPGIPPLCDAQWVAIEDEIEQLALTALPRAKNDPHLLLSIAKVLRFIDRGHLQLAARLTDDAFRTSTAFAAAFAMKGQIAASLGNIERALELYDRAIELTERGTQFHIYLLVIKGTALLAANRRSDIDQLTTELYALDPMIRSKLGIFFLSPRAQSIPPDLAPIIAAISVEQAQHLLMHLYRVAARQFQTRRHRQNVMRGAAARLTAKYGIDAIPPILRAQLTSLVKIQTN